MANSAYSFAGISGFSGFSGINQTLVTFVSANTFTAGQAIYRASGSFALAQANSNTTSDILGVVQSATSTQFTIVANGYITGLTGLTDSYQYYLSDTTPGALTTNPPSATGSVIKPVLIAIGSTAGVVVEYPGAIIGTNAGTSGYVAKWTSGSSQGNSIIQDNGTTVTITGNLSATGPLILPTINDVPAFNSVTVDWSKGSTHAVTLSSSLSSVNFVNAIDGESIRLFITNPSTYTVAWSANSLSAINWSGILSSVNYPVQTIGTSTIPKTDKYLIEYVQGTYYGTVSQGYYLSPPHWVYFINF